MTNPTAERLKIRLANASTDSEKISKIDTAFEAQHVAEILRSVDGFEVTLTPRAITGSYVIEVDAALNRPFCIVAECLSNDKSTVIGFASATFETWNRRAILHDLYVDTAHRLRGVAASLLAEAVAFANDQRARSLLVETQNTNAKAIQFYIHNGFRVCGIDTDLYDPATIKPGEYAVFLTKPLE